MSGRIGCGGVFIGVEMKKRSVEIFKVVLLAAVVMASALGFLYLIQGVLIVAESYDQPPIQRIFLPVVRNAAQQRGIDSGQVRMPAGRIFRSCDFWSFEFFRVECGLIVVYAKSTTEANHAVLELRGLLADTQKLCRSSRYPECQAFRRYSLNVEIVRVEEVVKADGSRVNYFNTVKRDKLKYERSDKFDHSVGRAVE